MSILHDGDGVFLSTSSARRTTAFFSCFFYNSVISIHVLREEDDIRRAYNGKRV